MTSIEGHEEWASMTWEHPRERACKLPPGEPEKVYRLTRYGEVSVMYFSDGIYVYHEPTNVAYRFSYEERKEAWAFARMRAEHVRAIGGLLG